MPKSGDVVLAKVQYTDTYETKKRPAVVLYEKFNNIVIAGVTSNLSMDGVSLTKKEGALKESVIKTNYIFTITKEMIVKSLFKLSKQKRKILYDALDKNIQNLIKS